MIDFCTIVDGQNGSLVTVNMELYVRIPSWLGSNYWTWYASRIHDSISNGAIKHIGFSADESACQCIGSTADSASRYRTSITTGSYTYVSTFASKPK